MNEATSIQHLLFSVPLYVEQTLPPDMKLKGILSGNYSAKVDGHCLSCGKETTYAITRTEGLDGMQEPARISFIEKKFGYKYLEGVCSRHAHHTISFWFLLKKNSVMKVGQLPSLADIANDEASNYRKVLTKEDANELHKAIGLAAHGVGIGSFVYLRRIFERLISRRFEEFKEIEGWSVDAFAKLRMNEKVTFLADHLPPFLVENSKLYSILSAGLHELSDDTCLRAFEPIKLSLKIILEEDKKKQEELELRKLAAAAIQGFTAK